MPARPKVDADVVTGLPSPSALRCPLAQTAALGLCLHQRLGLPIVLGQLHILRKSHSFEMQSKAESGGGR